MESFVASDGMRLAYAIDDFTDPWKRAPTLLLLHAAMGSARRYYAWVPRSPGITGWCGWICAGTAVPQVPPADRLLTLDRLVTDVTEMLDHLGLAAAHVVGNSAGGYLGQQLAMNQPSRVRSLMLFGSTPGLKNSQAPSWIPQIAGQGAAGVSRRDDRRPAAARSSRSRARRVVSRSGGQERSGLHRQVRPADGEL